MTNITRKRQIEYTCLILKNHFLKHKWLYILLFSILLLGIILGVITIGSIGSSFELDDLRDQVLLDYLKGENTWVSFFLLRLLEGILFLFIIWLCSCKKWLILVDFLLLLSNGYFIGINCTIIILTLGFMGVIYTLFIIAPCYILTNILLICIIVEGYIKFDNRYKFDCSLNNKYFIKTVLMFSALLAIIKLFEMLLISIFMIKFLILS